jgi:hypothetical protein
MTAGSHRATVACGRRALVAADTTCNTADRHPLAATTTIAALRVQALWAGNEFARQAARATATDPQVQNYVLEVNAHRSNEETIDILTCLLTNALRPDPSYRLPCPHYSCTDSSTTSATSPPTCGDGPTGSHWPDKP